MNHMVFKKQTTTCVAASQEFEFGTLPEEGLQAQLGESGTPPGMLRSVFWGLLRLFFMHALSTYIPASCRLRLAVSD